MNISKIKKTDIVIEDPTCYVKEKDTKRDTGYPYNLKEEQIIRIIYFFGSRRLSAKALGNLSHTSNFTSSEKAALKIFFQWFGFLVDWTSASEVSKAYKMFVIKFKNILGFLKTHPAYITKDIYNALKIGGYNNIIRSVIFVVNENNQIVPRLLSNTEQKEAIPLAKLDAMQWEIQSIALDKILLILNNITPDDIASANLGMKSKALRDIYAMYHMSKINNKTPNLALININVNSSEPKDKLKVYSSYIAKNRENS
jgi:hypothetical protein